MSRRRWEELPVVRTHHAALTGGLHPGEYRIPTDTYEHYLVRAGAQDEVPVERRLLVEHVAGVTLRLEIERYRAPRRAEPADVREALDKLLRAALDGAALHD